MFTKRDFETSLQALRHQKPFRPFTVELITGERVEVYQPESLVHRSGVAVYFSRSGEMTVFDHEGVRQIVGE